MSTMKKKSLPLCALWVTGLSLLLTMLMTFVIARFAYSGALAMEQARPCLWTAVFLSIFASSLFLSRGRGRGGIICGLVCAGGYLVFALMIYALGTENIDFSGWFMRIFLIALSAGALGGMLSIRQNSRLKKRRKKKI